MKKTKLFAAFCAAAAGIMLFSASVFADDILGSHSFDGGTDNGSDIVFKGNGAGMGSLAEEEGNYFIRISGQNNWNNFWYKPADTTEKINAFWEDTSVPRKMQVEFDIRDSIGNGRIWVTLGADDQDPVGHGVRILTTTADGNVGIADEGGNSQSRLKTGGLEANVWYHYTFTIDVDNKTIDATLSDGENTYTVTDLDLYTEQQWTGWWIEGYTREPFNVIGFGIPGTPHNVDIDNVKFTRIAEEEEEPEPDSDILGSHSFDGGTDNGSDIVFKGNGAGMGSLAEEEGNYFIRISGQNNWNNFWYKPADTTEKINAFWEDTSVPRKMQVEFDIRDSIGNGRIWVTLGADDQDPVGHGVRILTTTADGNVGIADEGGNSQSRLKTGGLEANVWYHYTFTIDVDNKTIDATLSDGENTYTVTDLDLYTEQQWTGWWIEGFTYEPFNVIGFGIPGTPHNVDIDNIVFKKIVAAPSVSADKITISAGSAVQGVWTNVSASADKIAIDFGTEMDISSLTDNVYIINKQTQEKVAAEGRLDKSIYTLNLTQQLEKDTEYTIFIGKDAANTTGMALGADYSFDFRTDAGRINVNIDSVEKSGEAVTSLSQLAENDSVKLNISYTNSTNEAQSFYVIVAYYNGSQMVRVSLIPISRDAGVTSEQIGIDYTVPEMNGADSAKVMCWDNFTQIRPLGEFLNL